MKKIIHSHSFVIERCLFEAKTNISTALDLYCAGCGIKMFVEHPSVHFGDQGDRPFYANYPPAYEVAPKKPKK